MKENFVIHKPQFAISRRSIYILIAIILAILIVFSTVTQFNVGTLMAVLILVGIAIMLIDSMRGDNPEGSLPFATYPVPPHLGLDGVSLENRVAGKIIS